MKTMETEKGIPALEYNVLTTKDMSTIEKDSENELEYVQITKDELDWLREICKKQPKFGKNIDQSSMQLQSLVGVLTLPSGRVLEILPKFEDRSEDGVAKSAEILKKILDKVLSPKNYSLARSGRSLSDSSLTEYVAWQFMTRLKELLKRGLKSCYRRVEEEQPFLRGQLDIIKQTRQLPYRLQYFNIRYDLFTIDTPENRLLRSALDLCVKTVKNPENQRLGGTLKSLMAEMPPSVNYRADFNLWRDDRLMADYSDIKAWCQLVLGQHMFAVYGQSEGINFLFDMNELFEMYFSAWLRDHLEEGAELTVQGPKESLLYDSGRKEHFFMIPDNVVKYNDKSTKETWVLDTKWKPLYKMDQKMDQKAVKEYNIQQEDIYQMAAYERHYVKNSGGVVLVYPHHKGFPDLPNPFYFRDNNKKLIVASFDILKYELDDESKKRLSFLK